MAFGGLKVDYVHLQQSSYDFPPACSHTFWDAETTVFGLF